MSDINVMRHVTKDITNEAVTDYLTNFYKPLTPELGELRTACEAEPVPIILRETEDFLNTFMDVTRPGSVLEIGTAVGYSAMFFAEKISQYITPDEPCVVTIEKDGETYERAKKEISALGYDSIIECYKGDGEECIDKMIDEMGGVRFDLIFIDAAKSHYKRFLEASLKVLSDDGVIICGCHPGDCHYSTGNYYARRRMTLLFSMLDYLGIERDRTRVEWVSAAEGAKFAATMNEFTEAVKSAMVIGIL